MENKDKPAFPVTLDWSDTEKKVITTINKQGLTKREYFAAKAMQGILSGMNCQGMVDHRATDSKGVIELCIVMADELLKQLESK